LLRYGVRWERKEAKMNRINGNKALAEYLSIGLSTVYSLLKQGYFQNARVKRSPRLVAYIPELVDEEMKRLNKL